MTITITPAFQDMGKWVKGTEDFGDGRELTFSLKFFEEPSDFGIDCGKIIKLEIRLGEDVLARYERGWDIVVTEEARLLYESILAQFN